MKILILTVGSHGDVRPYVALASGLRAAGHAVTICTCSRFEGFIRQHGIGYAPLNNDLIDLMDSDDGKAAMEDTRNLWQAVRTGIKLLPKLRPMMRRQIDEMWQAADSIRPDLILFHKKALGAEDFAEKLGVPCALAFYLPLYVATGDFPAMGFPSVPLGRWYNRLTYKVVDWVTRTSTDRFVRPWRRANGLSAKRRRYRRAGDDDAIAVLHAFSRSVIPQPEDWPASATVTGYWFLNEADRDGQEECAPLVQFLSEGPPPVYVGFGSISGRDPRRTTRMILEAIRQANVRAVLATGWGGLNVDELRLPESVLAINSAPHGWLFPRASVVVHHGGCGTTAAGLLAGKPTIVCPFFGDQPFWGGVVHRLGVGPRPIPQRKLNAERLASAIRQAITDSDMRQRAARLGERISREDGVGNAVKFIEQRFA
ncbi:MAG: glycosyltransferase [Planctomycetota bacterium]